MRNPNTTRFILLCFVVTLAACGGKQVIEPDNDAPDYRGLPAVKVENYVNRSFIDLIGREPTDIEMAAEVAALRAGELKTPAREAMLLRLQSDKSYVEGDSSYWHAWRLRFYESAKARLLEGASDEEISQRIGIIRFAARVDSLNGDSVALQRNRAAIQRLVQVLRIPQDYGSGSADLREVYARLLNNAVYDEINMNSFNFVRACFNDIFLRLCTQAEFDASFPIIEYGQPGIIFGQAAGNKAEFVRVLVGTREFHEGLVRVSYSALLAREPNAVEVKTAMDYFYQDRDLPRLQRSIMVTDEYAGF